MAHQKEKTEHAGAKHAAGFRGHKADAKHQSSRRRRVISRTIIFEALR